MHHNDYLANLGIGEVDHIVVSHCDGDYSEGIGALLSAGSLRGFGFSNLNGNSQFTFREWIHGLTKHTG